MTEKQFWNSIPRKFFNRLYGYTEMINQNNDFKLLNTKLLMFWQEIQNPYIDKKHKAKNFEEFNKKLSGDKENKTDKPNKINSKAQLFALVGLKDKSNGK